MDISDFSSIELEYSSIWKKYKHVEQRVSKSKNCKLKNDGLSWGLDYIEKFLT